MDRGPKLCMLGTLAVCVLILLICMFVSLAVAQPVTSTPKRHVLEPESGDAFPWATDNDNFSSIQDLDLLPSNPLRSNNSTSSVFASSAEDSPGKFSAIRAQATTLSRRVTKRKLNAALAAVTIAADLKPDGELLSAFVAP